MLNSLNYIQLYGYKDENGEMHKLIELWSILTPALFALSKLTMIMAVNKFSFWDTDPTIHFENLPRKFILYEKGADTAFTSLRR